MVASTVVTLDAIDVAVLVTTPDGIVKSCNEATQKLLGYAEADLVGMELAARAGFDPRAGVTLWQKMSAANKNAPPQWLSTHPSGTTRIHEIEANLPKVMPLFERARN